MLSLSIPAKLLLLPRIGESLEYLGVLRKKEAGVFSDFLN